MGHEVEEVRWSGCWGANHEVQELRQLGDGSVIYLLKDLGTRIGLGRK